MKIIGISNQNSGCAYHRILLPLGFMNGITGYVTNIITEDKQDGWDILLYNRICPYDQDWNVVKGVMKVKVVMDIDDHWKLPPNHLCYDQYKGMENRIINNLVEADIVTASTDYLAEKIRPYNNNVHVLPNAIPFGLNQFIEDKRECDRIRIFWAGSVTHEADIHLLRNCVQHLKGQKDKIKMVIGGYNDEDPYSKAIWQRMFSSFTSGGQLPYMKLHAASPLSYMQMYEHADIMLIPLEESEWHACKSNLKILEAAVKKVPCIVSNVKPYNMEDAPVLWVNNKSDWFKHINYLINNPNARQEQGEKLYEWATRKYNLADVNQRRAKLFSSLCETPTHLRSI